MACIVGSFSSEHLQLPSFALSLPVRTRIPDKWFSETDEREHDMQGADWTSLKHMRSTPMREHQLLIVVSSAHPHSTPLRFISNRMLYNSVMARAPHFTTMNLGRDEARYWHKRIYSGLVRISFFQNPVPPMLICTLSRRPSRKCSRAISARLQHTRRTARGNTTRSSTSRSVPTAKLSAKGLLVWQLVKVRLPCPRQASAITYAETHLALFSATRLWQYAGRPTDTYGLRAACEAAAAAASVLAERVCVLFPLTLVLDWTDSAMLR